MAYVILSRRGRLGSTWPSGSSRKSTPDTPISAAAARCSPVRRSASWRGSTNGSSLPLSPRVTRRYRTSAPPSTQRATVPAAPNSMSSGWAATTSTRSGAGNRSIAIGQVSRVVDEGMRRWSGATLGRAIVAADHCPLLDPLSGQPCGLRCESVPDRNARGLSLNGGRRRPRHRGKPNQPVLRSDEGTLCPRGDFGVVAEKDDLSLGTQCVQDREEGRTSLAVRLGRDLVEDERRRLVGGDQVLSHGHPQQQVDLLTRTFGEQPGFSPDARPRLLDLD